MAKPRPRSHLGTIAAALIVTCAFVAVAAPGEATARKKPELIYAWVDCAFPNPNRPPCQLSVMGDRIRKVRVRFQKKKRTIREIPLQPGPLKQVIPIYQWWEKNPPINIGPGHYNPKKCMKVKARAMNASGKTRGKAKICKDKDYFEFK